MASLARNIIWNSFRVGSNMLFPLITFPYIARILGPAVKGEYDYVHAIVSYFILFANLGFPIYGIREIAQNKESRVELSKAVSGIFSANIISASIISLLYVAFCFFLPKEEQMLFAIIGSSILFSCIQFDWFYQGVEDFKYITLRSILIKILSLIALFCLVHSKEDLLIYAAISVISEFGNNIFNLLRIGKYADLKFSLENCWKHTKGASTLFLGTIAVSLYTQLNTVMLGALDTKESVGYFTTGNKMIQLVLTVVNAMLSTIIPRISYQLGCGHAEEGRRLQYKVLNITLYICIPLTIWLFFFSENIILLLAGDQFMPSIQVLKILSLLLVFIPLSGFLGLQVLYPVRKEVYGNYATIAGAMTNLIANFFLIWKFSYIGIAVAVVLSEFVVTAVHYYYSRRYLELSVLRFFPKKAIVASLSLLVYLFISMSIIPDGGIVYFIVQSIMVLAIYLGVLKIQKDILLDEIITKFIRK